MLCYVTMLYMKYLIAKNVKSLEGFINVDLGDELTYLRGSINEMK